MMMASSDDALRGIAAVIGLSEVIFIFFLGGKLYMCYLSNKKI